MPTGNGEAADGSDSGYLCRLGRNLMISGVVLAAIGGLLLVIALTSTPDDPDAEYMIIIGPQIVMMMIGAALAVTGFYYRCRYCG